MRTKIAKKFHFDAAHFLPNVEDTHKCKRLHGHTYQVEVILEGEPDSKGFIVDYAEITNVWKELEQILDHVCLNTIPELNNPTTEILAAWIFKYFKTRLLETVAVRVYESTTTWCEVCQ